MEDRETARMRKYGESKTTRIMMATVPHVTSGLGLRKFQADGFWLTRVYVLECENGSQVLDTYFHLGLKVLSMSKIVVMTTLVVQHSENGMGKVTFISKHY